MCSWRQHRSRPPVHALRIQPGYQKKCAPASQLCLFTIQHISTNSMGNSSKCTDANWISSDTSTQWGGGAGDPQDALWSLQASWWAGAPARTTAGHYSEPCHSAAFLFGKSYQKCQALKTIVISSTDFPVLNQKDKYCMLLTSGVPGASKLQRQSQYTQPKKLNGVPRVEKVVSVSTLLNAKHNFQFWHKIDNSFSSLMNNLVFPHTKQAIIYKGWAEAREHTHFKLWGLSTYCWAMTLCPW